MISKPHCRDAIGQEKVDVVADVVGGGSIPGTFGSVEIGEGVTSVPVR